MMALTPATPPLSSCTAPEGQRQSRPMRIEVIARSSVNCTKIVMAREVSFERAVQLPVASTRGSGTVSRHRRRHGGELPRDEARATCKRGRYTCRSTATSSTAAQTEETMIERNRIRLVVKGPPKTAQRAAARHGVPAHCWTEQSSRRTQGQLL